MVTNKPTTRVQIMSQSDTMKSNNQNYKINKKIWELIESKGNSEPETNQELEELLLDFTDIKEKMGYEDIPENESLMSQILELQNINTTTVTIHIDTTNGDFMSNFNHELYFDYEGRDAETGNPTGTLITPNNDGDYVINNVIYGEHNIYPSLWNEDGDFDVVSEYTSMITVTKEKNEFTALDIHEPQVPTQEEI